MIALALVAALQASEPSNSEDVIVIGAGRNSCAAWLKDGMTKVAGRTWILGYWSGLNQFGGRSVGRSTDTDGLLGEVEKVCRDQPSLPLYIATYKVFKEMKLSGL